MNQRELHELLTQTLGLLCEPASGGFSCSYFLQAIERHPQRSTRVLRVMFDRDGQPSAIQLCASSDHNHAVLVDPSIAGSALIDAAAKEMAIIRQRRR